MLRKRSLILQSDAKNGIDLLRSVRGLLGDCRPLPIPARCIHAHHILRVKAGSGRVSKSCPRTNPREALEVSPGLSASDLPLSQDSQNFPEWPPRPAQSCAGSLGPAVLLASAI